MGNLFPPCDKRLTAAIRNAGKAAVIAHRNPDGDALYSSLAMREVLSSLGKETYLLNEGPFLRDDIKYLESEFAPQIEDSLIDDDLLVIILDCSTPDRPGKPFEKLMNQKRIVIDHHSSGVLFVDEGFGYIVPESPSTTLLVDKVREELGVPLTEKMADYLYRGFATDTGFYHFLSSSQAPESLRRAASFAEMGVSPYEVYDEMHDGRKLSDIKNAAAIIMASHAELDGKVIFAYQSPEIKEARLSDSVYATLLEAENVMAVIFIKDKGDALEIGFRSKNKADIDVGRIASSLGGGGHKKAAGATITGYTKEEAEALLLGIMEREISSATPV